MAQSPDYSVVIPFFNDERFFASAFESVIAQSAHPAEIIAVVDGAGSVERHFFQPFIARGLAVHTLECNQGSAVARNRGVEAASSRYVAFLDADDLWAPQKMHRQLEFLATNPDCVGCHTGVRVIDARECQIAVYADKPSRLEMRHLLNGNQVLTSSFVIERQALMAAGGFDARYRTSQDFELVLRLVRQGASLGFLSETLATLRRAGHGNISSRGDLLIRNHARIARDYRRDLVRAGGRKAYLRFLARYLYQDGARMSGLQGLLCRAAGKSLSLLIGER